MVVLLMPPIFLPDRSDMPLIPFAVIDSTLPPVTNVGSVKSTCSWRDNVIVVEPHSISILPLTIAEMRSSDVTRTNFTSMSFFAELGFNSSCNTTAQIDRISGWLTVCVFVGQRARVGPIADHEFATDRDFVERPL